jgi:hypothetical protein
LGKSEIRGSWDCSFGDLLTMSIRGKKIPLE